MSIPSNLIDFTYSLHLHLKYSQFSVLPSGDIHVHSLFTFSTLTSCMCRPTRCLLADWVTSDKCDSDNQLYVGCLRMVRPILGTGPMASLSYAAVLLNRETSLYAFVIHFNVWGSCSSVSIWVVQIINNRELSSLCSCVDLTETSIYDTWTNHVLSWFDDRHELLSSVQAVC